MTRGYVVGSSFAEDGDSGDEDEFEMPESLDVCLLKNGYAVIAAAYDTYDDYVGFERSIVVSRDVVVKRGTFSLLYDVIFREYEANIGAVHEGNMFVPHAEVEFLYTDVPGPETDDGEE